MLGNHPRKFRQFLGRLGVLTLTYQAHVGARRSRVRCLWTQTNADQPREALPGFLFVQRPTPAIRHEAAVDTFRCNTARLAYLRGELAVTAVDFQEIHAALADPFLQLGGRSKLQRPLRCAAGPRRRNHELNPSSLDEVLELLSQARRQVTQAARVHACAVEPLWRLQRPPGSVQLPGRGVAHHAVVKLDHREHGLHLNILRARPCSLAYLFFSAVLGCRPKQRHPSDAEPVVRDGPVLMYHKLRLGPDHRSDPAHTAHLISKLGPVGDKHSHGHFVELPGACLAFSFCWLGLRGVRRLHHLTQSAVRSWALFGLQFKRLPLQHPCRPGHDDEVLQMCFLHGRPVLPSQLRPVARDLFDDARVRKRFFPGSPPPNRFGPRVSKNHPVAFRQQLRFTPPVGQLSPFF